MRGMVHRLRARKGAGYWRQPKPPRGRRRNVCNSGKYNTRETLLPNAAVGAGTAKHTRRGGPPTTPSPPRPVAPTPEQNLMLWVILLIK